VANIPDVAWTADVDGRRTFVSDNVARVLGYTPEEIYRAGDRLWWTRIAPDHAAHAKAAYDLLFTAGQEYDVEYRVRRKDGRWIWVRDRSIATYVVDGVRYADGLLSDITERKGGEAALAGLQEEQQRRIGRELHDSTAQTLTALSLNLAVVKQSAAGLDPRGQRALNESLALAHQCSREIRTLCYLLHPPLMDELGLAAALQSYADGFAGRSGIRVHLELPSGLGRLASDVERAAFRLVQECLTNIHRHSGSPTASIRLVQQPTMLTVQVTDEGRGMPSDEVERTARLGVGIAGMRERVRQLGGRLDISSGEAGTTVTAVLPLVGQEG
jgi:PAS domain S-box-containing protein